MGSPLLGRKSPGLGRASESCCRDGTQHEGWEKVWRPWLGAELHQGSSARPASVRVTGGMLWKKTRTAWAPDVQAADERPGQGGAAEVKVGKDCRPLPRPLRVTSTVVVEKGDMSLCWGTPDLVFGPTDVSGLQQQMCSCICLFQRHTDTRGSRAGKLRPDEGTAYWEMQAEEAHSPVPALCGRPRRCIHARTFPPLSSGCSEHKDSLH